MLNISKCLTLWVKVKWLSIFSLKIKMTPLVTKMFKVDPLRLFSSWLPVWVIHMLTQYLPSLSGITIMWHSPYVRFFYRMKNRTGEQLFYVKVRWENYSQWFQIWWKRCGNPGSRIFWTGFVEDCDQSEFCVIFSDDQKRKLKSYKFWSKLDPWVHSNVVTKLVTNI